jgi:hypothetical protein
MLKMYLGLTIALLFLSALLMGLDRPSPQPDIQPAPVLRNPNPEVTPL